ncbi:hypothetical protein QBC46DRAFT_358000 [Diplogelasinospora grovesii]|uniref:Uncharacterized protein n=1 Tax=Diplogelasinospora grovesii TaxID=303347 RepID=A0AAN6MYA3_9PEZI|nr:hypothetical protein QBC46DRAFT_358000 [Diplogelasinospora grovesii]
MSSPTRDRSRGHVPEPTARGQHIPTPLLTLAAALSVRAVDDNLPTIQPGLDWDRMETDLRNSLSLHSSTWDYWGAGWIPQACRDFATGHGLSPYDFTVFNVHYDDCSEPWIMCRHKDSHASEIDMIGIFGRMPVHMRSYVRQFMATPGLNDGIAGLWMYPGDIMVEDRPLVRLLAHEMSHGLDYMALTQYGQPFSGTDIWRNNYAQDSAVPSDYSRTNFVEDFAEVGIIGVYDKVVPGGIGTIEPSWNRIFHQYATYQGYLGDNVLPGGSCRARVGNSQVVPMGNSAKTVRRDDLLGPKPDVSFKNSTITVINPDPKFKGLTHVNPGHHAH